MFYVCRVEECSLQFFSVRSLIGHMQLLHSCNKRLGTVCGLDDCSYLYNTVETFRKHVRVCHSSHWESSENNVEKMETECDGDSPVDGSLTHVDGNIVDTQDPKKWEKFQNDFAKYYALFKLKITESYMLPKTVAQSITLDVRDMFDLFQKSFADTVVGRLQNLNPSLAEDSVLRTVLADDSFFDVIQNKTSTDYLFTKYLRENMHLNPPVEVRTCTTTNADVNIAATTSAGSSSVCGSEKPSNYQYVSVLTTLKNYLEQPDVWASCNVTTSNDTLLRSFTDGSLWAQSAYANIPNFLRLHLYSDEVEICNPIGSRKTVHKLSVFYFLVGNVETQHWSKLSNIHLALMCKYKDVKQIGYAQLLEPLLADIRVLESDGICINIDGASHRLFGTIVTMSGDNLTSHAIGGFNMSFSSGRICRHCMVTKLSLQDIFSEVNCTLRTPEGHAYHLHSVQQDKDLSAVYGVYRISPFAGLQGFSPVTFFPPDCMHDILEGLIVVNICVVLKHLVRNKLLSIKQFNQRLVTFKFGIADTDKFGPLSLDFVAKNKSISGTASEKWTMFRLLPFLVADLVPVDDEFWRLHTLCRELCEIVLAPVVDPDWLPYLELIISDHHKLLSKIAPESFTPKVHFVTHYPRLLAVYGPLRHLWTMRFEAVHQYFKQLARRTRNFLNVTSTLATRYQNNKCYEKASNTFLLSGAIIPAVQKQLQLSQLPTDLAQILIHTACSSPCSIQVVYSVRSLNVNGQRFKVGCYVVHDVLLPEEIPCFACIKYILSVDGRWLICGATADSYRYDSHLHAYAVKSDVSWVVYEPKQSLDCQWLSVYKYKEENFLVLQHKVASKATLCQC